jgi:FixJ family two-component response regulator
MLIMSVDHTYIAVVDDDESLCRSLSRLLRAAGFQPVGYRSAEDFLADERRPRFDCLVLDISLPGISGLELHRQLVTLGSLIPVIYLTAQEDTASQRQAHAQGCTGYFSKTKPGPVLLAAIRSAVSVAHPLS